MDIIQFIKNLDISVFVEVGCHFGTDTEDFRKMHPSARIVCFEPDPRNLKMLEMRKINEIAEVYPFAVSNVNGLHTFYLSSGDSKGLVDEVILNDNDWSCSSSLKKPTGHLSIHKWITFPESIEVSTIRLDDFEPLKNMLIDFMWVDVQGAEDLVFSGASETLKHTRYVYTEYCNTQLYEGQLARGQILDLFGKNWMIVHDFGGDILLRNVGF
jgi:2-O-methyltransferase